MSGWVFLVVILAACLHAGWNSLVKSGLNKKDGMAAIVLGHVPLALIILAFAPAPAPESWTYIVAGAVLHFVYQIFLLNAYRIGDLTQVYPVARGIAPLLVAVVSVAALGVALSHSEGLAILLIATGLVSLAVVRRSDGSRNPKAFWLAAAAGCMIASYSLVDGLGARLAGTALGFYGWLSLMNGALMLGYMFANRGDKKPSAIFKIDPIMALVGGGASFAAYALVIWAFTQAPIALVTALRETSIVFALLIGVFVLNERLSLAKLLATFLTIGGAALLRLGK